jgi:hypothetical protein
MLRGRKYSFEELASRDDLRMTWIEKGNTDLEGAAAYPARRDQAQLVSTREQRPALGGDERFNAADRGWGRKV